jgi:lipid-A-disaccharide synthase
MPRAELLVVAGEASGDRAAAGALRALAELGEAPTAFGMGGPSMSAAGVELVADLREVTALGVGEVAARACGVAAAYSRTSRAARRRAPQAALLVSYTEFNARLAKRLHARGVRVLWYGAPQIWAWRPERAPAIRRVVDRMAVVLPFEEPLWRKLGVDAHYVGHPAREAPLAGRDEARERLGLTPYAHAVAILPGSRPHEVSRLLLPMLEAYERVRLEHASVDGRVLLAPTLDERTRTRAIAQAKVYRVPVIEIQPRTGLSRILTGFDAALCASGTAALEAALARAVPIVAYKVDLITEIAARRLLRTRYVALPNVLLGRDAFVELLQRQVAPGPLAEALATSLERRDALVLACDEVEHTLGDACAPSRQVARMLVPWL